MESSLRRNLFKSKDNLSSPSIKICITEASIEINQSQDNISTFHDSNVEDENKCSTWKKYGKRVKMFTLVFLWFVCSFALMQNNETIQDMHQISVQKNVLNSYQVHGKITPEIQIMLEGALLPSYYGNLSQDWLKVWVQVVTVRELPSNVSAEKLSPANIIKLENVSAVWHIPIVTENLIGVVPEVKNYKTLTLNTEKIDTKCLNILRLQFRSNLKANLPLLMGYNPHPINPDDGIVYAALVLCGLYILIIFEVIHRTVAAMLASTISVAILAVLHARPTLSEIISWIDIETVLLLFSMMTLVAIFSDTGIFGYAAVWVYKITGGKLWPLINILSVIVVLMSCFLDNVTTALLITPVTIKLCEVMKLNPVPVLMIILMFVNIGGVITPIGDPPNVIIASNKDVVKSGVNFATFTLHMGTGALFILILVYVQLRLMYKNINFFKSSEPEEIEDLKREIAVWQRTAASLSSYSKDEGAVKESLKKKSEKLQVMLKITKSNSSPPHQEKNDTLNDLEKQNPIRNKDLLVKSGITLFLVIGVLFLHSIPALSRLGMGWTSLLGALLLLILYDHEDTEGIFARVEWCTLIFFASLFILMEALSKLGLIEYIGRQTRYIIMAVGPESRLAVAIVLILWVSAFASAFVDNLPLTTMMIRVATDLSENNELNLPLQPLIWALSYGACLGGNGSLFGSSSNIICAGVAEQHGYKFSFTRFMKVGVPVTITSLIIVNIYLVVCHVVFEWH